MATATVPCAQCGKPTEKDAHSLRRNRHSFCSVKCAGIWQSKQGKRDVACSFCGIVFQSVKSKVKRSAHRFCSKACYSAWQSAQGQPERLANGNSVDIVCDQCGSTFQRKACDLKKPLKHHFCNWNCYSKWRMGKFSGTDNPCWKGGRKNYGDGWGRALKAEVRRLDSWQCRRCGKTKEENGRKLDVHHIVNARAGGKNCEENLVTLCASCHKIIEVLGIDFDLPERCELWVLHHKD